MLEFSEEWKSFYPIGAVYKPPLLLSPSLSSSPFGPLFFSPLPPTITSLFSSPSLSPPLPPPPSLTLPRFISTTSTTLSSTSSSISPLFGVQFQNDAAASSFSFNRLVALDCPYNNSVILFFPTNDNSDQIGFVVLYAKDGNFRVTGTEEGGVFLVGERLYNQITRILVNPVQWYEGKDDGTVGYLLVSTMYSVYWYRVEVKKTDSEITIPVVQCVNCKLFKSCAVVSVCWSPHIPEESLVLLENGGLFLFDLKQRNHKGTRFRIPWEKVGCLGERWLGCEFGCSCRIFIVARSDAVYMVNCWRRECELDCFAKIGMSGAYGKADRDSFIAFCKAAPGGFLFAFATGNLLTLCDVRKPLRPVLQWTHYLHNPSYINVFRLSELRSHCKDDRYQWASDSGFCIVLGSFWNCEFSLFCYGPSSSYPGQTLHAVISRICKSLYAWGQPAEISLSGCECGCGSCTVREEFSKDFLPWWIHWQTKKDVVLGFSILSKDLSMPLSGPDECGGFTLIRLLSSGKLESQRYGASWESVKISKEAHKESSLHFEYNLPYSMDDKEYRFTRRFKYYKFDYLYGYLGGKLAQLLESNLKELCGATQEKESFSLDIHEILCEKLKACGFGQLRTSPAVSIVFDDIILPTSIQEVALRRMWAGLPMELLQLSFSSYSEILEVLLDQKKTSLEFLVVPSLHQLPPFFLRKASPRSNKWSKEAFPGDNSLVGPVLPLPVLLSLHEIRNGCLNSEEEANGYSLEKEYSVCCDEIMQVANEMGVSDFGLENQVDLAVSLADDGGHMWGGSQKEKPFFLHRPTVSKMFENTQEISICKENRYSSMVSKVLQKENISSGIAESVGQELFDNLCPIKLKFGASAMSFTTKQLKAFNLLKRQFSRWQEGFTPYKEFCSRSNLQKQNA